MQIEWGITTSGQVEDVLIAPNIAVPERFTAQGWLDGYKIEMVLEADLGSFECVQISVTAPHLVRLPGEPSRPERYSTRITGSVLRRIPIDYLVKESVRAAMMVRDDKGEWDWGVRRSGRMPDDVRAEWPNGDVDKTLRWIASCYRQMAAIGDPPNAAIQEATGWSRATASRAIKMARERALLTDDEQGWGKYGGPRPKLSLIAPGEADRERFTIEPVDEMPGEDD